MTEYKKFTVRIPEQFIDYTVAVYEGEMIMTEMVNIDVFELARERVVMARFEVYDEFGMQYPNLFEEEPEDVVESSESVTGPGTNPGV